MKLPEWAFLPWRYKYSFKMIFWFSLNAVWPNTCEQFFLEYGCKSINNNFIALFYNHSQKGFFHNLRRYLREVWRHEKVACRRGRIATFTGYHLKTKNIWMQNNCANPLLLLCLMPLKSMYWSHMNSFLYLSPNLFDACLDRKSY